MLELQNQRAILCKSLDSSRNNLQKIRVIYGPRLEAYIEPEKLAKDTSIFMVGTGSQKKDSNPRKLAKRRYSRDYRMQCMSIS